MTPAEERRPDPDDLLQTLQRDEERKKRGRLKIFFGMCAGVGKTYAMLKAAHEASAKGISLLAGYVETHGRKETQALLKGLEILPSKTVEYRGTIVRELDIDGILARKPSLVLIDELAHSNAPGSRHAKRYQDVIELLDNGIDVYSTLNVQHLESRADTVAQITGANVRETVPDSVFENADSVEIVDLPPDELLKRLSEGKVYTAERSKEAVQNFFRTGNLTALREMALRLVAERVDHQLRDLMKTQRIAGPWKSGQRLLVGVSPSPNTVRLIRWARRTAYTMDATWVAVYVERSHRLSRPARDRLAGNIKLARELGAEIVTTADEDIVEGILRVAREQNVTQILIGKPRRHVAFSRGLLDRLIEKSGELDIYVVGGDESAPPSHRRLRIPDIRSGIQQYLVAAGVVLAVSLALYPTRSALGYQTVSLILLLMVIVLPLKLGEGPVLLAAALSALVWDFFFIPPQFTFAIGHLQDVLMFGLYFGVAAVTGVLTARIRAREKAVRVREQHASALYGLTKELSLARSQDDVVRAAVENIRKYFGAEAVALLSQADGDIFTEAHPASTFTADPKDIGVAAWVYWNEKKAGRFTDTLPSARATYFPLSGPRYPLGVVGVHFPTAERLTMDQEALLDIFLRQISSALEREQLHELARKSLVVAESERLYKTLFDSLSHEFRTPVATILGATDQLREDPQLARGATAEILTDLHDAADRLNHLVQNLLDMTRLESGLLKIKRDWCDIADLVGTAVRKVEDRLRHCKVTIDVSESIPLFLADQGLLEQALVNILHNAAVHAVGATDISIVAYVEQSECLISVADNGQGIPPHDVDKVFGKFYRSESARSGGTGLGLSIARGIVEAHGGAISCTNRDGGGAQFTLRLPIGSP
ncbi:sensor histidine kinase KdpD, partial [bacterium]|nr:sensor histidine kinase KdpD [bacterium]